MTELTELPVHTLIGRENSEDCLLLCGLNHGLSKQDERKDAAGIDRSTPASFFSDGKVNDYPFRNRVVSWFSLWGYELARCKGQEGAFERSIVQTNWLQTCSNNMHGKSTQRECIEDNKSFLHTCEKLSPGLIFFFGIELLSAFTSPVLDPTVASIFGKRTGNICWRQKDVLYKGKLRRRFRVGFQQYERLAVVGFPHATGAKGIANDYIEAFKPEMAAIIEAWWAKHKDKLIVGTK